MEKELTTALYYYIIKENLQLNAKKRSNKWDILFSGF